MTSDELLAAFRDDVVDNAVPPLWSDLEIYRYLDDAQTLFCRLTGGLGDASTPAVTQLAYSAGATALALHPSVLKVRAAYQAETGRPLEVLNYEDLAQRRLPLNTQPGPLRSLILGMEPHTLRPYPVPNDSGTVALLVDRLPLKTINDDGQALEIDAQHHTSLLLWMKALAYAKQDAEVFDQKKADACEARFKAVCASAKLERERAVHKPRVVAYGGL